MLDSTRADVAETRMAKKTPLTDADVRALLESATEVVVARGKRVVPMKPSEVALDDLKGPTGSYRAPILLVGKRLLVGFHAEALAETLAG